MIHVSNLRCWLCVLYFLFSSGVVNATDIPIIDAHNQSDQHISYDEILSLMNQARVSRMPAFGAMGEVIMWHAEKKRHTVTTGSGAKISPPQIVVHPDDPRVKTALALAIQRKWPFVLHIEFAAAGADRKAFMSELEDLLRGNYEHQFAMIHMGQLEAGDVGRLINSHPNIYFLTSNSNPLITSQSDQPWSNMFEGRSLASRWKALVIRHAERFILGFDCVFAPNWRQRYVKQVTLWRRALKELPDDIAHAVAHGNAERLWRLPAAR